MAVKAFLVERRNPTTVVLPAEECRCTDPHCYRRKEREETRWDAVRTDSGDVLAGGVEWWNAERHFPEGALWWSDMSETSRPAGPDDWAGYDEQGLDLLRASFAEHPEWYRHGPGTDLSLPRRQPSFLFESGRQLMAKCPGGLRWVITSRASNCTMPYDYSHRCWVVHGEPPEVTVDKNGATCQAGAGSIQTGNWHGFLVDGWFRE